MPWFKLLQITSVVAGGFFFSGCGAMLTPQFTLASGVTSSPVQLRTQASASDISGTYQQPKLNGSTASATYQQPQLSSTTSSSKAPTAQTYYIDTSSLPQTPAPAAAGSTSTKNPNAPKQRSHSSGNSSNSSEESHSKSSNSSKSNSADNSAKTPTVGVHLVPSKPSQSSKASESPNFSTSLVPSENPASPSMPSEPKVAATPEARPHSGPHAIPDDPDQKAAVWWDEDGTETWTKTVLRLIEDHFYSFDNARDASVFCPGYDSATHRQKELCWLRVIGAIVKFESHFNPIDSFREPNGNYSVGLFSLSPGECDNAKTLEALRNPIANLTCGVLKLAQLIGETEFIDGPKHEGAAVYWSTLRPPYTYKGYHVGKKEDVIEITSKYQDYK
jgi:hypothetical protein